MNLKYQFQENFETLLIYLNHKTRSSSNMNKDENTTLVSQNK